MLHQLKLLWLVIGVLLLNACVVPHRPTSSTISSQPASQPATPQDKIYIATVIKVSDGDTITVQDNHGLIHKIRLAYIDAPETKQHHGLNSQADLSKWIHGKPVRVLVRDIDRYRREVAIVEADGHDVNYRQIELGNAWHYTAYAKNQLIDDYHRYQAAMSVARTKGLGLWSQPQPQAPWDYRKQQRSINQKNTK